ncbi:MAG: ABC transporter permease [Pseudomonadota bacterium]
MTLLALLSHWRRNPLQLVTFMTGLALATALWSGVQAINAEARASYQAAAATLGEGQFDQIVARDGNTITLQDFVGLRRAGWQVSPVVEGELHGVRLVGVDPLTSPGGLPDLPLGSSAPLQEFLGDGVLFGTAETLAHLQDAGLAGHVVLQRAPSVAPGMALGDIGLIQTLLDRDDLDRLRVSADQPLRRPALSSIAPHLRVQETIQRSDLGQMTDSFHLNLTAFGLLSFAVGLFIVHGAIGLTFEQRRGTLRTLRALGVPLRRLTVLVAIEMLCLSILGALLGIVLGYVVAAALLPDVAATLRGLYGASMSGTLSLRPEWWLSGFAIAIVGTTVATADKLWQVAHMPLLASAHPRAWSMKVGQGATLRSLFAVALFLGALVLMRVGDGLLTGFAIQGALLLGAALALPAVLSVVAKALQGSARGVMSHWFWADTRQQLPGLSLALMALLLAVSANIGVATMVSSFRLTFIDFLDQRLASELYVALETDDQSAAVEASLLAHAGEVLPLLSADTQANGIRVELDGVRVGPTYRENWQFLGQSDTAWSDVADGKALIVNEQFARRADIWVGDPVTLRGADPLPIGAVVADYGNPRGQVVVSEALFFALFPDAVALRFGVRTDAPDVLIDRVGQDTGLSRSAFTDQAEIKAFSLRVFERTFTVTAALNILTLGVAGFAMLMSLLTLADMRVPQLAPVWAAGLTRRTLGRLELLRALALAVLVFLLALPLGLALAWVLLAIVNVEAFGWRLPMFLFPGQYLQLGLLAVMAGALAALWPALRLARMAPGTLLKVFANDR